MTGHKYLADGRKVVVIGSINKTEFIVQEIFVTDDGSEIPSGENFTAKALLDEPAKSYKEKEAEKIEAKLEQLKQEQKTLSKEIRKLKEDRLAHSTVLQSNEKFLELFEGCDISFLSDIVTGNIKYLIPENETFNVQSFEDAIYRYERSYYEEVYNFRGLRTLNVMCAKGSHYPSDRKFYTTLSSYEDGSGSTLGVLCFNSEEAVQKELEKRMYKRLQSLADKPQAYRKSLTSKEIEELEKWITVPEHIKLASKEEDLRKAKEVYENAIEQAKKRYTESTGEVLL